MQLKCITSINYKEMYHGLSKRNGTLKMKQLAIDSSLISVKFMLSLIVLSLSSSSLIVLTLICIIIIIYILCVRYIIAVLACTPIGTPIGTHQSTFHIPTTLAIALRRTSTLLDVQCPSGTGLLGVVAL